MDVEFLEIIFDKFLDDLNIAICLQQNEVLYRYSNALPGETVTTEQT